MEDDKYQPLKFNINFQGDFDNHSHNFQQIMHCQKMATELYYIYNTARSALKHGEEKDWERALEEIKDRAWFIQDLDE